MKTLKFKIAIVFIISFKCLIMATPVFSKGQMLNYLKSLQKFNNFYFLKLESLPSEPKWELCYESDQIYIYERWIPTASDRYIRERKGEMYVNCNLEKAVNMINDYQKVHYWNQNVKECKLIKRNNASNWVTYTMFELPWPLTNRDVVSENNIHSITPGCHIEIEVKSIDNMLKLKEGITRITKYNALWTIKKITNQKCLICFTASCDNPPVISRKIQDPIVRKSFYKNLLSLKKCWNKL